MFENFETFFGFLEGGRESDFGLLLRAPSCRVAAV